MLRSKLGPHLFIFFCWLLTLQTALGGRACSNLFTCADAVARCLFSRFGVLLPLLSRWDVLLDLDSAVLVPSSQHMRHENIFRVTVLLGAEPRGLSGLLTALMSGARARRTASTYSFYFCRKRYCAMVCVLMGHSALCPCQQLGLGCKAPLASVDNSGTRERAPQRSQ